MGVAEPESLEKGVKKPKVLARIRTCNPLVSRQTPQTTDLTVFFRQDGMFYTDTLKILFLFRVLNSMFLLSVLLS